MTTFFDKTRTTRFSLKGNIVSITGIPEWIEHKLLTLKKLPTGEYLANAHIYGNWLYATEQFKKIQESMNFLKTSKAKYTDTDFSVGEEIFFDTFDAALTNSETADKTANDDAFASFINFLGSFEQELLLHKKPYRWGKDELKAALACMKAAQKKDTISDQELYEAVNNHDIEIKHNFYGPGKFIIYTSYLYAPEIRRIFKNKRVCSGYYAENIEATLAYCLKNNIAIPEDRAFLQLKQDAPTALEVRRKELSLSRKELSEKANISLRTLEQYEQKRRSIRRAPFVFVYNLAKALCANMEDIVD